MLDQAVNYNFKIQLSEVPNEVVVLQVKLKKKSLHWTFLKNLGTKA
jgi:hypothetical protein